jgi:hypothetical protein
VIDYGYEGVEYPRPLFLWRFWTPLLFWAVYFNLSVVFITCKWWCCSQVQFVSLQRFSWQKMSPGTTLQPVEFVREGFKLIIDTKDSQLSWQHFVCVHST